MSLTHKPIVLIPILLTSLVLFEKVALSASENNVETGHGLNPSVLLGVAIMLIVAKLFGELFERFGQPAVLGELIGGIVLGNLVIFGFNFAEPLKTNETIAALAEIGVIILLFEVGLESNLTEMMEVGWSSLVVAVLGVVAPFFLGWGVAAYFIPGELIVRYKEGRSLPQRANFRARANADLIREFRSLRRRTTPVTAPPRLPAAR